MKELAVILLSGKRLPQARDEATDALRNRGFEVFAEKPLQDLDAQALPQEFTNGALALIAFNPLMQGQHRRDSTIFADMEVEKAAHLLAVTLEDAAKNLRVATTSDQAQALADRLLTPQEMQDLKAKIAQSQRALDTQEPVLADLSRFKYRAKVELIEWHGQRAVKKTFRPSAMDAMEREKAFFDDISKVSTVPAKITETTENALVFEFIDNCLKVRRFLGFRLPIPLALKTVRELSAFVHLVADRGWDPLDLTPANNIMIDRQTGGLRAIDFEFAHRWDTPLPAHKAYFLSGVPQDATIARPLNNAMDEDPYPSKWRPYTGLSKTSFLNDPSWLQTIKRVTIHPFWLVTNVLRALVRRQSAMSSRDADLNAIALKDLPPS